MSGPGRRGFEDLIAWQKARSLTADLYASTGRGGFAHDLGFRDQMRRAAVSIMSNIGEGHGRDGPSEFHRFLSIAKGSCSELRSQLYVARDVGHLTQTDFDRLMAQADEVFRLLVGLRAAIARSRDSAESHRPTG